MSVDDALMIDALFNQSNYVSAKKLLDFTVLRQEAIASNMANLETPNYKRMDVAPTFASQLQKAIKSTDVRSIQSIQPRLAVDTSKLASKLDGNTVELETEMLELNKNYLAHTVETKLITGTLKSLRLAITGRPS